MALEKQDIIKDDALMAPLILADNLEQAYEWMLKTSKAGREMGTNIDQSKSTKALKDEITKLAQEQAQLIKVQNEVATVVGKTTTANKMEVEALNKNRVAYSQLRTEEERSTKAAKELLKSIQDQTGKLDDGSKKAKVYTDEMARLKGELKQAKSEMIIIAETLGEDSEEFRQAALKAGELSDKMGDISDASKVLSGDTTFEKIGSQFGLFTDKLKNFDIKGATTQLKGITATAKTLTFKESIAGAGGFTKAMGGLAKVILTNPLFLLVAVVIGIALAVNALKDKLIPLTKAFEAGEKVIGFMVQKLKDFSDWLGLSAFAAEDHAKRVVAAMEKQQKKLEQRYADEIKLAEAAGESITSLERSKQRAILGTSEAAIAALDKQKAAGKKLSEEQQEQYDKFKQMAHDAEVEILAINRRQAQELKKIRDGAEKEVIKQQQDRGRLDQFRVSKEIKIQEDLVKTEGLAYEQRVAASVKAEQLKEKLIKKERDAAIKLLYHDIFAEQQIREQAAQKILEVQKAAADEQRNLLIGMIQEEADLLQETVNDSEAGWEERIQAASEASERQVEILSIKLRAQLLTQEQYNKAVQDLEKETTDKIVELTLERQQKVMDAMEDKAATGSNDELAALEAEFVEGEMSYKDYLTRREEIQKNYQDNALQSTLDFLKEQRELLAQAGIDTTQLDRDISEISLKMAEDTNEKRIEGEELLQEKLKELRTAAVEGALEIIDNFNQAADEKRERESEAIQLKLENDLELVGTNEAAKAELRNKAEVEQAKLRKEQAAADRKRAIFEKATAAVSIGINTAKGIGMALGTYPPPVSFVLAAVVGLLGAIQLGVVLSKPIPSYAKGTRNHPGGLARVGEVRPETIIEPDGSAYVVSKESILDLPEHTQVIPDTNTINALALRGNRLDSTLGTRQDAEGNRRLERKLDDLNYTIRTKKELHINFTRQGAEAVFSKAESRTRFLNEFYH